MRLRKCPSVLTLADLDTPFIGALLTDPEVTFGARAKTRNLRLAAIRSFSRFVSFKKPAHSWRSSCSGIRLYRLQRSTRELSDMHVNKIHHMTTITQVAKNLGEDEDWLRDVANEMEIEDGVIWIYGVGEDGVQAFTNFSIENLVELIRMYKDRNGSKAGDQNNPIKLRLRRMLTQETAVSTNLARVPG